MSQIRSILLLMGTGCSSEAQAVRAPAPAAAPAKVIGRGLTYNPKLDYRVTQLAEELGEELIHAICFEFYRRVEGDSVMPEFTDVFTTPAAPASELLCWFLLEAWTSAKAKNDRRMYSAHRGSHFAFLHSTHRVWSFNLNEKYWQRWFHHFLGAAEHYRVLQEKARSGGKPVLLLRPDPTPLCKRMTAKFPPEHPHVHGGAPMCPFARRMMSGADGHNAENPHASAGQATVVSNPPRSVAVGTPVMAPVVVAPAPASSSSPSSPPPPPPPPPPACVFGLLTSEHIRVMQYYLFRLREWMDEGDLDKFGPQVHHFDEVPAPYTEEAGALAVEAPLPAPVEKQESKPALGGSHANSLGVPDSAAVSINPSVASSSSGSSASSSPIVAPIRPVVVAVSPNTKYRLYVPPAAPGGFTAAQVAQHNDTSEGQRAWTIIDGKIYNVTRFAHPGGARLLQTHAFGKDCSEAFHQAHPNLKTVHTKALEHMYIGKLIIED